MPNSRVIDLSHWNVIPESLKPAESAGTWGVIHKCTEGSTSVDDKYGARRWLASDAGLLFGAYHFLRAGDMKAQAQHFIDHAQPSANMLLAADHEDNRVSLADLQSWLEFVEELTGRKPVIYSGHVLKEQLAGKRHVVLNQDNYRLWLADYTAPPDLPVGWDRYWLWQWTQSGSVAGVTPPTDLNDYQGTEGALRAEWSGTGAVPQPEPEPEPGAVTLSPKQFQHALGAAGYYVGEVDGLWGPLTRAAADEWFADGDPLEL